MLSQNSDSTNASLDQPAQDATRDWMLDPQTPTNGFGVFALHVEDQDAIFGQVSITPISLRQVVSVDHTPQTKRRRAAKEEVFLQYPWRSPATPVTPKRFGPRKCDGEFCDVEITGIVDFCPDCDPDPYSPICSPARYTGTLLPAFREAAVASPRLDPLAASSKDSAKLELIVDPTSIADDESRPEAATLSTECGDAEEGHEQCPDDSECGDAEDGHEQCADEIDVVEKEIVEDASRPQSITSPSMSARSAFVHSNDPDWIWSTESTVATLIIRQTVGGKVQKAASTRVLNSLFPPRQRSIKLVDGRTQCRALARINPETYVWEEFVCKQRGYVEANDCRRHLTCSHLGDKRAEERKKSKIGDHGPVAAVAKKKRPGRKEEKRTRDVDDEEDYEEGKPAHIKKARLR